MKESNHLEMYLQKLHNGEKGIMSIFIEFFHGKKMRLLVSILALTIQRSPVWVIPIVTSNIINIATNQSPSGRLDLISNVVVALIFIGQNILSNYVYIYFYSQIIRDIEYELRGILVRKLQRLSIMFHKSFQTGKLQSKIMRDVENIEVFLYQTCRQLYFGLLDISVIIVVTLVKRPMITLFFATLIPIAAITVNAFKKTIRSSNMIYRKEMEETQSKVAEMLTLIPITRAHGLQGVEITKMNRQLRQVKEKGRHLDKVNSIFSSVSWVVLQSFQIICLAATGYMAYIGRITVGEVVLYQTYFSLFLGQVNIIISIYPVMSKSIESIHSISEIICESDIEKNNKIISLRKMKGSVAFQDVNFRYEESSSLVLDDFSLSVNKGESVAIVGDSGSGKTTILNLLINFMTPESGRILIDNINMKNLDISEYRRQLAVVPQDTMLFSGSIKDNITYGLNDISDEEVENVLRDVGLEDLIIGLENGIHSLLKESASNLSGGQRQRISIARALIRKPGMIVFDEATSALDTKSEKKVQEAIEKMMNHCTMFIVAHRLSTIKNADRIVVVEKGKIVEQGSYQQLLDKKGSFYELNKHKMD